MGKPNMGAQLGGVGVEAMQTENRGHVGFGSSPDIHRARLGCPVSGEKQTSGHPIILAFIAIGGPQPPLFALHRYRDSQGGVIKSRARYQRESPMLWANI